VIDNFSKTLVTTFPEEAPDILRILISHPVSCTCDITMQGWRVISSMCSTVYAFKSHSKSLLEALKAKEDDMTRKELKAAMADLIKESVEFITPEKAIVDEEYVEFRRLADIHSKDMMVALEKSGLFSDDVETIDKAIKDLLKDLLGDA